MSISYEQALDTLTSMFGPPWTEDSLDQVLRHFEGHMENTAESIRGHGDGEPQALLDKLENSSNAQTSAEQISMDEALALQMMQDEGNTGAALTATSGVMEALSEQNNLRRNRIRMIDFGTNIADNGCVMDQEQLNRLRQKRLENGLCMTCGRRCFKKSLPNRRLLPISIEGEVENGICLKCDIDLEHALKLSLLEF